MSQAQTPQPLTSSITKGLIARKFVEMGTYVLWEKAVKPKPHSINDVPYATEAMTPAWLTKVLCKNHPGAQVTSVDFGAVSAGTTNRRLFSVTYNDEGTRLGLPTRLYNKCTQTLASRLMVGLAGILPGEPGFYSRVQPELSIETPRALYAAYDPRTWRSAVILEDIATTKGAKFCYTGTPISKPQMEDIVSILAALHGKYWNSPRLHSEFTWLRTQAQFHADIAGAGAMEQCLVGIDRSASVLPAGFDALREKLWPAYVKSMELGSQGPMTFLHGDSHFGNYYQISSGAMGLCDWQVSLKGLWAYDYCYTLSSAISVENRRAWERDLLLLYVDRLHAAGGPKLSFDEAWLRYRQQPLYALHAWLRTIGRTANQPRMHTDEFCLATLERMSNTVVDLESVKAIEQEGS